MYITTLKPGDYAWQNTFATHVYTASKVGDDEHALTFDGDLVFHARRDHWLKHGGKVVEIADPGKLYRSVNTAQEIKVIFDNQSENDVNITWHNF